MRCARSRSTPGRRRHYPEAIARARRFQGIDRTTASRFRARSSSRGSADLPVARRGRSRSTSRPTATRSSSTPVPDRSSSTPNRVDSTIEVAPSRSGRSLNATAAAPRLPHPPDRLPGDRGQRRCAALRRPPGQRERRSADRIRIVAGRGQVLIDFRNPIIAGKFVYHCHILEHEDGGMMAVAEVVPSTGMAAIEARYQ